MRIDDSAAAKTARELEAQLAEFPNERGEILLEAAESWRRAGDRDRAIELHNQAVELGGEDGGFARVGLAELFYELDRPEDARAQLDALREDRPASAAPYQLAAELAETRGELQEALTWMNMAVSRLPEDELAELGILSYANNVLAGRRRIRRAMDLPPDDLDDVVSDLSEHSPFIDSDDIDGDDVPLSEVRVFFWPRDDIPRVLPTWPEMHVNTDIEANVHGLELDNRQLSEDGVARIVMIPLTVDGMQDFVTRTGGDPLDEMTHRAYAEEIVAKGAAIPWPPPRNSPCWCGSNIKYKKCCGRPSLD